VITGSGRGIGAAIAARLAADGLPVIVNYQNDENQADETTRSICAAGGQATKFRADVADPDAVASLVRFATDQFGSVGVVVNNAGGAIDHRTLVDTSWGDVERHLATHLRGSFLCVQAVLPGMIEGKFGRIVNITSQSAFGVPPPNMTGYVVAKAALAALTRCIALEAGPHGVTANAVAPGMVETELVADIPQRTKMALAAQSPLRRLVSPADVAEAVAFLVGPGGAHVTGQTIHLSGGQVMP
jgi:3-oxoacyl-[acyl-carrier protein] reductase